MKARGLVTVCLLIGVFVASSCGPAKAPTANVPAGYESIRMLGGSIGSRTATAVMALSAIWNKHYPEIQWSSSSGATIVNAMYVTKGTAKLGSTNAGAIIDAYGYDKIPESRLRSISNLGPPSYFVFLIPQDKPWKNITEVPKGSTFSPGPPGTISPKISEAMVQLAGLSKTDFNWVPLGKSEMADAWRTGKLDIVGYTVAGVDPTLLDMWTSPRKFKPMGLSAEQAAKAKAERTFQPLGGEAPAMSGLVEVAPELFKDEVVCTTWLAVLVSRDDFPDEMAYRLAKISDEHLNELAATFATMKFATPQMLVKWARQPIEIHPGIVKYYREKGYMK